MGVELFSSSFSFIPALSPLKLLLISFQDLFPVLLSILAQWKKKKKKSSHKLAVAINFVWMLCGEKVLKAKCWGWSLTGVNSGSAVPFPTVTFPLNQDDCLR